MTLKDCEHMILKGCEPEQIRALNEIGKQLRNFPEIKVGTPSAEEQEKAKKIIEQILPPSDAGRVNMPYVCSVLSALNALLST